MTRALLTLGTVLFATFGIALAAFAADKADKPDKMHEPLECMGRCGDSPSSRLTRVPRRA